MRHMEKEAEHDASHGSGQQHPPQDAWQRGVHRVQPLTALVHQLIERAKSLGVDDFLGFRCGLKRMKKRLKAVHPFHTLARDLSAALLRPGAVDHLFAVASKYLTRLVLQRLGI